jgi:hypothetical protein
MMPLFPREWRKILLDNQLFALVFSLLNSGFSAIGQGSILCQQNYQPRQQGVNTAPTVFVYKIGDERIGYPARQSLQGSGSAAFTGSITGSVLTVTVVGSGALAVNQQVSGAGIPANVAITSLGTGTGGDGTYNLNYAPGNVASESMTSQGAQIYTETEQYATTFQISALATQDPSNPNQLTASDIVNLAVYVMQSAATITALEAQGVGVLNIQQVRNPYFSDDRQRYEASPSADFTLTHKQIVTTVIPVVVSDVLQVLTV